MTRNLAAPNAARLSLAEQIEFWTRLSNQTTDAKKLATYGRIIVNLQALLVKGEVANAN